MYDKDQKITTDIKRPALVEWVDIVSWAGWNEDLIENDEDEPATFLTVGFIVKQTKDKLVITDCANTIGNVTVFPMGCVRNITYY